MLAAHRQPDRSVPEEVHQTPRGVQDRVPVRELMLGMFARFLQNARRTLDVGAESLVGLGRPAMFVGHLLSPHRLLASPAGGTDAKLCVTKLMVTNYRTLCCKVKPRGTIRQHRAPRYPPPDTMRA